MGILDLVRNGHLGSNEPAGKLQPHGHIADLAAKSPATLLWKHDHVDCLTVN